MSRAADEVVDQLLILRWQGGDDAALANIAERWQARLLRQALRLLGEREAAADAVQESWLAIVNGLQGLDDPARFAPWAYRIVRNKCADRLRRVTRARARQTDLADDLPGDGEASAEARAEADDRAAAVGRLRAAIRSLPGEPRTLLSLFYFEDMSVAAIAEALALPPGTVKSRLFHLRARLRQLLEES